MEKVKTVQTSGADENTPSLPQYFSWINNTNEGATEAQTLINLDYFKWLYDCYGMKLGIYAWDAGNLDGASGTYETLDGPKLTKQYPNGYGPLAAKAAELGCRLGVWAGADGFGDTPEAEKARYDLMVGLCKDYGFKLFKFDTVCGELRPEKRGVFKRMIDECRRYSPGLIVLNHRNDLGDAEICATTFLWEGLETYIDIHLANHVTAMHHRVGAFRRGLVPGMLRLTEDHGVCLSSCLDYFEDELILQAFNRSLILAPEIYGNPWFLRDDEQAALARIYNLHAQYAKVLVNGIPLPERYGPFAVSRGDERIRFITLRNASWADKIVTVTPGGEIGLAACEKTVVVQYHPYNMYHGIFDYDSPFEVIVPAFRVVLLAVFSEAAFNEKAFALTDCAYTVVKEKPGAPVEVEILKTNGNPIRLVGCGANGEIVAAGTPVMDRTPASPVLLSQMTSCPVPENAEALYEATMFKADNDALERQAVRRSGPSAVSQVNAARDAFFAQETYRYRGCESAAVFDGNPDTFFDANTRYYGTRIDGGCLRVDFGAVYPISKIEIVYFQIDTPVREVPEALHPTTGEAGADLRAWHKCPLSDRKVLGSCTAPVVKHSVHTVEYVAGTKVCAAYSPANGASLAIRYFRLPQPMDRIYAIRAFDETGKAIALDDTQTHANNMMAPYTSKPIAAAYQTTVTIPDTVADGDYISVAVNGEHGSECAYCAALDADEGRLRGFTDRAVSYPVNNWEHTVRQGRKNYTYYMQLSNADAGRTMVVYTLLTLPLEAAALHCDVYFCQKARPGQGMALTIGERP